MQHGVRESCREYVMSPGATCGPCAALATNGAIEGVVKAAARDEREVAKSTHNHQDLSFVQMTARAIHHKANLNTAKLQVNARRSVQVRERSLDTYQRIIKLLATEDITGLTIVLWTWQDRGEGLRSLLSIIARCINDTYRIRRPFTRKECSIATVLYRLGGLHCLKIAHDIFGLPSRSYLQKHAHLAKVSVLVRPPKTSLYVAVKETVFKNLFDFFSHIASADGEGAWDGSFRLPFQYDR